MGEQQRVNILRTLHVKLAIIQGNKCRDINRSKHSGVSSPSKSSILLHSSHHATLRMRARSGADFCILATISIQSEL